MFLPLLRGLRCVVSKLRRSEFRTTRGLISYPVSYRVFQGRLAYTSTFADADAGKGMKQTKNIQDPQNHRNHHNAIQD